MQTSVILTVAGSDRPGLMQALADAVIESGGNWLESHLARLRGFFVGSILIDLPEQGIASLEQRVAAIDPSGLQVTLLRTGAEPHRDSHKLLLGLVAQDRPGIVREVTTSLAALSVNIDSFESTAENSSWSGSRLFRAEAELTLPSGLSFDDVRDALECLSGEMIVDLGEAPEIKTPSGVPGQSDESGR